MSLIRVALAGNPNCGKTTLFNALTGARHYVGNWAGVTVEKRSGTYKYGGHTFEIVDLPGTYSLSPNSLEEEIARDFIVSEAVDVVINVVDATALERNLYLTTQILETTRPMIIALNMMDEIERTGARLDYQGMSDALRVSVVPIVAVKHKGLDVILNEAIAIFEKKSAYQPVLPTYSPEIEARLVQLSETQGSRAEALRALEGDEGLTCDRYRFVENLTRDHYFIQQRKFRALSDRIDTLLLNPFFGLPAFVAIMLFVFKLTFDLGNIGLDWIDIFFAETLSGWVNEAFVSLGVAEWMRALVVDAIIGGVGGVLTFVPNIAVMFIALSFLEDSGYMARVAFIMDPFLRRVGLNGKSFIPMVLGFGCNVPAIMATRTLDTEKDRLLTILINPFMSCGARLPVYVLFAGAFFPGRETLVMGSLYFFGILVALLAAYVLRRTILKSEASYFVMEIPPYRLPSFKSSVIHVWERVKDYLVKAGTVIFAASVILWFVMNYNFTGMVSMNQSFGAMIGGAIGVLLVPLGFGTWQAGLSLLTGIVAKEVVVSNMAIAYGFSETVDALGFYERMNAHFTPVAAYAFLVFVLLYTPCVAVIGAVKKETNSWKWTSFSVVYQLGVAWTAAFVVATLGNLLF